MDVGKTTECHRADSLAATARSAGGAYIFTEHISASLKIVKGANEVNEQSDVARAAFRWTF